VEDQTTTNVDLSPPYTSSSVGNFETMAYVAPIHRATSIRHALKANVLDPEIDDLIVA
jgi:hypothetical protein